MPIDNLFAKVAERQLIHDTVQLEAVIRAEMSAAVSTALGEELEGQQSLAVVGYIPDRYRDWIDVDALADAAVTALAGYYADQLQ